MGWCRGEDKRIGDGNLGFGGLFGLRSSRGDLGCFITVLSGLDLDVVLIYKYNTTIQQNTTKYN